MQTCSKKMMHDMYNNMYSSLQSMITICNIDIDWMDWIIGMMIW